MSYKLVCGVEYLPIPDKLHPITPSNKYESLQEYNNTIM